MPRISKPRYETYKEASEAAIALGIETSTKYKTEYKQDPRLSANPAVLYKNKGWHGWIVFLGRENKGYYGTYEQASEAAIALGIETSTKYRTEYKQDPRLIANPHERYKHKGWDCWEVFLGREKKDYYKTYEEASEAAIALGIEASTKYITEHKQDPRLSSTPDALYKNKGWDCWEVFLGREKKDCYETYEEAAKAAIALGITINRRYRVRYKEDPRLPSSPELTYAGKGWDNWDLFLGIKYCSYRAAVECISEIKPPIRTLADFSKARKDQKPKLKIPAKPTIKIWPEYYDFASLVGNEYDEPIEAAALIRAKGISIINEESYLKLQKLYPSLPINPLGKYNFKSFDEFLDFNKDKFWGEKRLKEYCAEHKIKNIEAYEEARRNNPYLVKKLKQIGGTRSISSVFYKHDFDMLDNNDLNDWVELAEGWVSKQYAVGPTINFLRSFFIYELKNLPTQPATYFIKGRHTFDVNKWLESSPESRTTVSAVNKLIRFFDYVMEKHCADVSDEGEVVYLEGYVNPIKYDDINVDLHSKLNYNESRKLALPFRYIDLARKYLVPLNNDGVEQVSNIGELFEHLDAKTEVFRNYSEWFEVDESIIDKEDPDCIWKETENGFEMWSPVRVIALYMHLYMPFRGSQTCWLDSGEADSHLLTNVNGEFVWQKNKLLEEYRVPLKDWQGFFKPKNALHKGVITFSDNNVHCHVNTNKAAKNASDGYDIPWVDKRIIPWLIRLRNWQTKYNPLEKPTEWTNDFRSTGSKMSATRLKKYGHNATNCFLFRDPTNKGSGPLTQDALSKAFSSLLYLIQEDEFPLAYIHGNNKKFRMSTCRAYFTLHSMRVSLITAFVRDAGIAPEIVQKLVGHSSLVMTIYYVKVENEAIQEQMDGYEELVMKNQSKRLLQMIRQGKMKEAISELVGVDGEKIKDKWDMPAAAITFKDFGVCPNGCTRCLDGGESIDKDRRIFAPVAPGYLGTSNCLQCRHFATGSAFIGGIQLLSNEISLECKVNADIVEDLRDHINTLEDEEYAADVADEPFIGEFDLNLARSHYEQACTKFDGLVCDLIRVVRLAMSSIELLNRKIKGEEETSELSLITSSTEADVSIQLSESTDYILTDIICRSSAYYQSANPKHANYSRTQMIDLFARKNGLTPGLFALTEKQQIEAGNEMSRLLRARTGSWDRVGELMDKENTITLNELGIDDKATIDCLSLLFEGKPPSIQLENNSRFKDLKE